MMLIFADLFQTKSALIRLIRVFPCLIYFVFLSESPIANHLKNSASPRLCGLFFLVNNLPIKNCQTRLSRQNFFVWNRQ